jgi:hypothetical protein
LQRINAGKIGSLKNNLKIKSFNNLTNPPCLTECTKDTFLYCTFVISNITDVAQKKSQSCNGKVITKDRCHINQIGAEEMELTFRL